VFDSRKTSIFLIAQRLTQ